NNLIPGAEPLACNFIPEKAGSAEFKSAPKRELLQLPYSLKVISLLVIPCLTKTCLVKAITLLR
ncbi:MAG TPA: hypothetical protein PLL35_02585, partial [Candidatus Cloacimonas sp.]|nr:hypothetical protein [Candidatus Cloacimonas sp.]